MKIYFVTYGDRSFYISKKHLIALAKNSKLFDYCLSLGPEDLDYDFKKKYNNILNQKRGGGYWIWKHKIISDLLDDIKQNDIVVYCDAGASLNLSTKAKQRFQDYINMLRESQYSSLRMECEAGFLEKFYTYKEIFNYFDTDIDSKIGNSIQLQAGHMFYKKNRHSKEFFNEYLKFVSLNSELITDKYDPSTQIPGFIENRHDQSIFSILGKKMGSTIISNETEFRKFPKDQYDYPFLSVRAYGHGPKDYLKYFMNPKKFTKDTIFFEDSK